MRIVAAVLFVGLALVAAPQLDTVGAVPTALFALPVGVLVAGLLSDGFTPLAVALGALGSLAFVALAPASHEVAGAVLIALATAARSLRVHGGRLRGAVVLASLVAGAVAATVATRYAFAALGVRAAAGLVAGIVAALPMLVPADDTVAFALAGASGESPEPSRTVLLRAAMLRRRLTDGHEGLSFSAARRLERAWRVLVETAQARVAKRGTGADVLDQRIRAHVETLERFYAASDERLARVAGLDDGAMAAAKLEGESLEAEASALAEVSLPGSALGDASR